MPRVKETPLVLDEWGDPLNYQSSERELRARLVVSDRVAKDWERLYNALAHRYQHLEVENADLRARIEAMARRRAEDSPAPTAANVMQLRRV